MDRTLTEDVPFEQFSSACLRRDSERITRAWVERLSSQLGIRPRRVLPTDELLNHIPQVLEKAAEFLVIPDTERITSHDMFTEEMRRIARLRRSQGYDVQEIMREFDELAQLLDGAALTWLKEYPGTPPPDAVGRVFGRLNRAPLLMGEITVGTYQAEELDSRHAAAERLGEFVETLMHEIKTPLAAAEGAALLLESLEPSGNGEGRRDFSALIRRNLARARTIIDDVRMLALAQVAHAQSGRFLRVGEVLGEVLTEISPVLQDSGVRIDIVEPIPDVVVDAARVEIVLLNLIGNGAKYSDPDKPSRWVRVGFEQPADSEEWWAVVADNGLGIPAELHDRVFERFFRGHQHASDGSGLGLAIVREAIRQMNSRLVFESEAGEGTTFRFLLPVAEVDPDGSAEE